MLNVKLGHRLDGFAGNGFMQQHTIRGLLVPVTADR